MKVENREKSFKLGFDYMLILIVQKFQMILYKNTMQCIYYQKKSSSKEKSIVNQLNFKTEHSTTIGGFREEIWKEMFEEMIPKKFTIEQSVFIIDSNGNVSNEVDFAIFDETYTPYIFHYGKLKFLPIEAVAVVIECKSASMDPEKLKNWAESINILKTSRKSYTRMQSMIAFYDEKSDEKKQRSCTQTATRPIRILCCMNKICPGIIKNEIDSDNTIFDMVIRDNENQLTMEVSEGKSNLYQWYFALNHVGASDEDDKTNAKSVLESIKTKDYMVYKNDGNESKEKVTLLSLNLLLNQILMLLNNPIPFPHKAYAEMFNQGGKCFDEE